jgi:hypothetical protein
VIQPAGLDSEGISQLKKMAGLAEMHYKGCCSDDILIATLEKQGKRVPAMDSLVAAIALQGELSLVTRNEDDFEHAGITVINPWTNKD